jgi:hypothetical protein
MNIHQFLFKVSDARAIEAPSEIAEEETSEMQQVTRSLRREVRRS